MNCNQSNDFMMKYLDGELKDTEYSELMHHINKCSVCCTEFQTYNIMVKSLENDNAIEPPEDFELNVMRKINLMDEAIKLKKEKKLLLIYFLSSIVLTLGVIVCAVFLKGYILEIMKYLRVPANITYIVYGVLANIEFAVKICVGIVYYFKSTDLYYLIMGLIGIATISKAYDISEIKNRDNKNTNVL
jgi:predicted anti-sigma-YlaC factor YlaD